MCIRDQHYMAEMPAKLERMMEMVLNGDYFTISRPRQYGKTTFIHLLQQQLQKNKDVLVLDLSFEGISSQTYENHQRFTRVFLDQVQRCLAFLKETGLKKLVEEKKDSIHDFEALDAFIAQLIMDSSRKVVMIIDEVDKAGNHQLFLDFLGMLRNKYLETKKGKDHTFYSVILSGVHDIKTLKTKIRPEKEKIYNSPWNIAIDMDIDISLFPEEISSMLEQYVADQGLAMDIPYISEQLFYFTSGYPWLVSSLCKIIADKKVKKENKNEWIPADIEEAVRILLMEKNTNFDTLIKNLENDPELYEFVYKILMDGGEFSYNPHNPVIHAGTLYGILKKDKERTWIHNRIYEQLIYDYMSSKLETSGGLRSHLVSSSYIETDGTLMIEKVILKFQEFMKTEYGKKDEQFLERNGRLLFLAFIRPIINGKGFDFKEVQTSEERRLDVVITFQNQKYILELKIWCGQSYHQDGLNQLQDYLDAQDQTRGYLLIFDLRKESGRTGESETINTGNKEIFAAWV